MCSACRFCLSVYLDLSPRGIVHLLESTGAKEVPSQPQKGPQPFLRLGIAALLRRRIERREVGDDVDDVIVVETRNRLFHQRGVAAVSPAILEHVELAREV